MKQFLCFACVLIIGALLLGGCVRMDYRYHDHYPDQHGKYDKQDQDHGHYDHQGQNGKYDKGDKYDKQDQGQYGDQGQHDKYNKGDKYDKQDQGQYGDQGQQGKYDKGDKYDKQDQDQYDNPGQYDPKKKDAGERAIKAFVEQHEIPVRITRIERLPNLTMPGALGTAMQTIERYKVSMKTTDFPRVKVVKFVDYNPATDELTLEE